MRRSSTRAITRMLAPSSPGPGCPLTRDPAPFGGRRKREGGEDRGDRGGSRRSCSPRSVPLSRRRELEFACLRLRDPRVAGLRVCRPPVEAGRKRRSRDDHRAPRAERRRGARGRLDRRRRPRSRPQRRDHVAADRCRVDAGHPADGVRGDHAARTRPRVRPAPPERRGRREPPPGSARDQPPTGRLARLARRPAGDGPDSAPGSHRRWEPIATAESWNGGAATCNGFRFRFERVGVARSLGGSWRPFVPGSTFHDRGYQVRQLSPAPTGSRLLSAGSAQAYAFDALSA